MLASDLIILAASNPVTDIAAKFHVEVPTLIAQIVNFLIVAVALYFLAIKPVLATMDERQKKIEDGLQYAEQMKQELAEAEKSKDKTIKEAQIEAQRIVKEAQDTAKANLEKQSQEAIAKAEAIIKKGEQAVSQERSKMLAEVRQEIASLVVQTTGKVLKRELTAEEQKRLNDAAATDLAGVN